MKAHSAIFTEPQAAEDALAELRTANVPHDAIHLLAKSGSDKLTRQSGPSTSLDPDSGQEPLPRTSHMTGVPGQTSELVGGESDPIPSTARSADAPNDTLNSMGFSDEEIESLTAAVGEGQTLILVDSSANDANVKSILERNGGRTVDL